MIDANKIVREILETIDGVTVTFYHPGKFNKLPVISYYEIATSTGLCYDNAEQGQKTYIAIDIWGKGGGECSRLAIKADAVMQKDGWYRELSKDMPKETEGKVTVCHKHMRFYKQIFFERND